MNLSPRLTLLQAFITQPYANIWDGCCDHGLLGQSLMTAYPSSMIHFVDINSTIIEKLTRKLSQSEYSNWQCYSNDMSRITLQPCQTHLIILAGIGGQLMQQILEGLLENIQKTHLENEVEFLLAPIHHRYQLRSWLKKQNFSLLSEKLIEDNGRYYEVLHVSLTGKNLISLVGDELWRNPTDVHRAYLKRLIAHYERLNKNNPSEASKILEQYRKLIHRISQ